MIVQRERPVLSEAKMLRSKVKVKVNSNSHTYVAHSSAALSHGTQRVTSISHLAPNRLPIPVTTYTTVVTLKLEVAPVKGCRVGVRV